jgi:hypothetical protein
VGFFGGGVNISDGALHPARQADTAGGGVEHVYLWAKGCVGGGDGVFGPSVRWGAVGCGIDRQQKRCRVDALHPALQADTPDAYGVGSLD